ncbi:hypothetical protein GTQ99_13615 [Kineococcus sp. T13]|uniref:hypothetical protein n=1 Tax=Kineococcus vitellinus TaxID=2696565 RepID=UPI001411BA48|nr:hypothetical protein [Kineococcus vitellinus]NAZ76443.1 hypothetical protein [Kineococcus vitellinus]
MTALEQGTGADGASARRQALVQLRERIEAAVVEAAGTPQPGGDPDATLELVTASKVAAEETSRLLRASIDAARSAGHRWDTIGTLLGVSKQAAQQRFGQRSGTPGQEAAPGADGAVRRVLTPLTAFDEMEVLAREGRRGWHVVDYGTLYHLVEASEHQWEHLRQPWNPAARRRLTEQGWTLVKGTTFPWGYWKRPLDLPAEP